MILGVPAALLASLWLTWGMEATSDGDRVTRGIAVASALVIALAGAAVTWRARTGPMVAIGLTLLAASAGALRGTVAVRDTGPTSPVTIGVVGMRGVVISDPEWRGARLMVPVRVDAIARTTGAWEVADGRATMQAPLTIALSTGNVIEAIPGSTTRTSFVAREIHLLDTGTPTPRPDDLASLRRRLASPIEAWMPEPEASLATGILLGDRTGVPSSVRAAFNATGAAHMVAISGWNVSLVAASLGWLMTRGCPHPRRLPWQVARAVATSVALWGFVALVGASGSVLRAAAMAQIGLVARMTERRAAVAGTLLWGAVALAMIDPGALDDVGWQLSFLGASGLVWMAPWIAACMAPPPGARWGWLIPAGVRDAVGATIAAQACVLPVLAGTIGSIPMLGIAATTPGLLLVPPLMMGSAALSLAGVALSGWSLASDWIMPTLGALAWVPGTLLVRLVGWAALLPGTSTSSPPWHPVAVMAYLLGLSILVVAAESPPRTPAPRSRPGKAGTLLVGLGTLAAAIMLVAVPGIDTARASRGTSSSAPSPTVAAGPGPAGRVIVPPLVGQPDGTLAVIAMPGGPRMMIGGGPTVDAGTHALGATIRPWDRTVDAIVMASAEVPSSAGIARAVERYRIGAILDLTDGSSFGLVPAIRAQARAMGVTVATAVNGEQVVVGDASRFTGGACPATASGAAVVVPIGAGAARLGGARGPSAWPAVAVRVCAGWADVTVVPDVVGASIWLARAPASETFPLAAQSGRARWLVVPWRAWRSDALDVIRQATGASLVVVQGAPERWKAPARRPANGDWWVTALDGPLDVGDDR